jgi:hypothetical protein
VRSHAPLSSSGKTPLAHSAASVDLDAADDDEAGEDDDDSLHFSGWLTKKGKARFVVLDPTQLGWFDADPLGDWSRAKQRIPVRDLTIDRDDDKGTLVVTEVSSTRCWTFSGDDQELWLRTWSRVRRAAVQASASKVRTATVSLRVAALTRSTRVLRRDTALEMERRLSHSLGGALFPRRIGSLADALIVVGPTPDDVSAATAAAGNDAVSHLTPHVLWHHPGTGVEETLLANVPGFAFPAGVPLRHLPRTQSMSAQHAVSFAPLETLEGSTNSHIALVTGQDELLFAVTVVTSHLLPGRSHDTVIPRAYVLLTRFPFFSVLLNVLVSMVARERLGGFRGDEEGGGIVGKEVVEMLRAFRRLDIPRDQSPLSFALPHEPRQLEFSCAPGNESTLMGRETLATLAACCPLPSLERVLSTLLLEGQLVLVADSAGILTAVALALIPALRPFVWQGAFVPILPAAMRDALCCPVPFVLGVVGPLTDEERTELPGTAVVLDLTAGGVLLPPREGGPDQVLPLPGATELRSALADCYVPLYTTAESPERAAFLARPIAPRAEANDILAALGRYVAHLRDTVVTAATLGGVTDMTSILDDATARDAILANVEEGEYRDFVSRLLDTQHFVQLVAGDADT